MISSFPLPKPYRGNSHHQRGSAYVLSLLVLLVLSLLGLSLAVTTTTEMQIGANEELLEQSLFAGDAGLSIAVAARLVRAHTRAETFLLTTDQYVDETPLTQVEADIDAACVLNHVPCNGCEVTISNDTNGALYVREMIALVSTGRVVGSFTDSGAARTARTDDSPTLSKRLVTGILDVQPIERGGIEPLLLSTSEKCAGGEPPPSGGGPSEPLDSGDTVPRGCENRYDPCPL